MLFDYLQFYLILTPRRRIVWENNEFTWKCSDCEHLQKYVVPGVNWAWETPMQAIILDLRIEQRMKLAVWAWMPIGPQQWKPSGVQKFEVGTCLLSPVKLFKFNASQDGILIPHIYLLLFEGQCPIAVPSTEPLPVLKMVRCGRSEEHNRFVLWMCHEIKSLMQCFAICMLEPYIS